MPQTDWDNLRKSGDQKRRDAAHDQEVTDAVKPKPRTRAQRRNAAKKVGKRNA